MQRKTKIQNTTNNQRQKKTQKSRNILNIKKQTSRLYVSSVLGNLSLTGAWVAILAARGYRNDYLPSVQRHINAVRRICAPNWT